MLTKMFAAMMFHITYHYFFLPFWHCCDNWYKRFFYHTYYGKVAKIIWNSENWHCYTCQLIKWQHCKSGVNFNFFVHFTVSIISPELKAQVNFSNHFLPSFHTWVCPSVRLSGCNLFKFSTFFSRTTGSTPIKLGIRILG